MRTGFAALIPREHGAWAMLATAFVAGLILARSVTWLTLASAGAALAAFLIRDSLVILCRQAWIWRQPHAETIPARWFTALLSAVLLICAAALLAARPAMIIVAFAAGAAILTFAAVFLTVKNRQRSPWMQVAVAIGLNGAALAAWISARTDFPSRIWWLWAMLAANSVAGVLTVHARLDAKRGLDSRNAAWASIAAMLVTSVAAVTQSPWLVIPGICAGLVHAADLRRQRTATELAVALRIVGLRAMTFSIVYSAAVLLCLSR